MCLAVPAEIIERNGDNGCVLLGDARMRVNLLLTPDARAGDWVLVHAGFAIQTVDEQAARATWEIIDAAGAPNNEESLA